jgi:hypothetical protein
MVGLSRSWASKDAELRIVQRLAAEIGGVADESGTLLRQRSGVAVKTLEPRAGPY